jgi:hypothetical protein
MWNETHKGLMSPRAVSCARATALLTGLLIVVGTSVLPTASAEEPSSLDVASAEAPTFTWQLSPRLTAPDRWFNPMALASTDGTVGAVWEEPLGGGNKQVRASLLGPNGWTNSSILGTHSLSDANVRQWPNAAVPTVSWLTKAAYGPSGFEAVWSLSRVRSGVWETREVQYSASLMPGLTSEVSSTPSGDTILVAAWGSSAPAVSTWKASDPNSPGQAEPTQDWDPKFAPTDFAISQEGQIAAAGISKDGLRIFRLDGLRWELAADLVPAGSFNRVTGGRGSTSGGDVQIDFVKDGILVTWQQLDARYGEDYQVWSAAISSTHTVKTELLFEATRPYWTNSRPWIEMNVAPDGRRCLTHPEPSLGNITGRTGTSAGWDSPIRTNVLLPFALDLIRGKLAPVGRGCVFLFSGWFGEGTFQELPQPTWSIQPGTTTVAANGSVVVHLEASGTQDMQAATLALNDAPPIRTPGGVESLRARPVKGQVRFSWLPPKDLGGAVSVQYEWRTGNGAWKVSASRSVSVRAASGKPLRFEVRARNEAGVGPVARISSTPQ